MNKKEFLKLLDATDDISTARVSKIMSEFCETTTDENVLECLNVLDTLFDVQSYMEACEVENPTLQQCIDYLRLNVLNMYTDTLKEK